MKKIKILILGYSSFVKRRVLPALKNNKALHISICSKSNKKSLKNKIFFNSYEKAIKEFSPDLVYVSLINSLHFKYAKKLLLAGYNTIVDKPITTRLDDTRQLLKIARRKKILLAEATIFNYHRVFKKIIKLSKGKKNIVHIQSNFNIPLVNSVKNLKLKKGDCEMDMSPYAASVLRIFNNQKIKSLSVKKTYFKNTKIVKDFTLMTSSKNLTYFGNFGLEREYTSQIIFFTKKKIIISPERIFALPPNQNIDLTIKENNKIKKIRVKKDDCIKNFFRDIILSLKNKKFNIFYKNLISDAIFREKIYEQK